MVESVCLKQSNKEQQQKRNYVSVYTGSKDERLRYFLKIFPYC